MENGIQVFGNNGTGYRVQLNAEQAGAYGLPAGIYSPENLNQHGMKIYNNNSYMNSPYAKGLAGVQALSGLANAWTGMQGLKLAKDQFNFGKAATEANFANQAKLINEQRGTSNNVGLALAGSTMTDAQKQASRNATKANNVRTTI